MSSIIQIKLRRPAAADRTALGQLTAMYTRSHDAHEAPIVGCYLCLHNAHRRPRELAAAA